ncbi:uncharacterized protein LY89DRAFT_712928 [Mollisia scopiformis]|uniref:RING-type domain-containing protein n=1 Tax=Mollisia scopiformis TaxID=149040 RepID=A0A194XUU4_MOLSC|nr:uncharacterized protein LY89DRAFT_712928 [Mollisia scopiformis]KUJ23978.1 hypothetical protein LY89DRAFT_712928 [Mollisia scopiformis]
MGSRVARLRADRDARLQQRIENLEDLWYDELEDDTDLFYKPWKTPGIVPDNLGPGTDPSAQPMTPWYIDTDPWFSSRSMDGEFSYILEDISKYAKARLGPQRAADIDEMMQKLKGGMFDRDVLLWGIGSDALIPDDDTPLHIIATVLENGKKLGTEDIDFDDVEAVGWDREIDDDGDEYWSNNITKKRRYIKPISKRVLDLYPTASLWSPIRELWGLLKHLRILRRFADGRNPEVTARPLPNGENIPPQHDALTIAWVLHRAWIRMLHYRTLVIGIPVDGSPNPEIKNRGLGYLYRNFQLSLALLSLEMRDVKRDPESQQDNLARYSTIHRTSQDIDAALKALGQFIDTETRPPTRTRTKAETRVYNLRPDRIKPAIELALQGLPVMWKLWSRILRKTRDFNKASDVSHIEDVLVSKRLVYDDEWFFMAETLIRDPDYDPEVFLDEADPSVEMGEQRMIGILQKTAEVNRLRRNKLLLTEWSESRPWKQLYVMCDTSAKGQPDLIPLIEAFWTKLETMKQHYKLAETNNPSNEANVWSKLFTIHPLATTDPPSAARMGGFYEGDCCICQEDYKDEPDKIFMRLHCNHYVHFTCVRTMWDNPDKLTFPCPLCRTSASDWHLHDHAGISPENPVLDVWDYEELEGMGYIAGAPNAAIPTDPHPDMDAHYHRTDLCKFVMSTLWDEDAGYPYVNPANPRNMNDVLVGGAGVRNREPSVEMAVMRKKRRIRNRARAELAADAQRGYEFLDPSDAENLGI